MSNFFSSESMMYWCNVIGYPGLSLIFLLETGFFLGFFFPGDSLLFVIGVLCARGVFHFWIIVPLLTAMSILGYVVGYWVGQFLGGWLTARKDTWYYKRRHMERAKLFYGRYGPQSLFLGRFIPIVRTFIPILSGIVRMNYLVYTICNVGGAIVWVGGVCALGYWLGTKITSIDAYLIPIVALILLMSVFPFVYRWLKAHIKPLAKWVRSHVFRRS